MPQTAVKNEVKKMKKILSFILAVIMTGILLLPMNASAISASSKAGIVSVSSGNLNVRNSSSTNSAVVSTLKKGSYIVLISKSGNWWLVEYSRGRYGYCHEDYITELSGSAKRVNIQSGSLNVRSGPSTSYSVSDSLTKDEIVLVLSSSGSWYRVLYNGTKTGYVSSQYLASASSSAFGTVSLNVPDFKQTDSRWANKTIGNSGKTIGQIGCATTGIAMMQSYRTGTTIYPDAMSKKLSYTSSGSVYWPSDYTVTTNSTDYLSRIYNLLKAGKPVLFGAKNSYGGQHWVVITGFTGGSTLSASSFTINDPGSKTRTNLQQFLNAYPNFYKYFNY